MKQLDIYDTLANASNLKLLCGLSYSFPLKYPKTTDPKKMKAVSPVSLRKIIADTDHKRVRSHDDRFDNKHPIELAIMQLKSNGLTKDVQYKILKNKASVIAQRIKGPNSYLANFISDEHKAEILSKLSQITINKYGQFVRNGQIF